MIQQSIVDGLGLCKDQYISTSMARVFSAWMALCNVSHIFGAPCPQCPLAPSSRSRQPLTRKPGCPLDHPLPCTALGRPGTSNWIPEASASNPTLLPLGRWIFQVPFRGDVRGKASILKIKENYYCDTIIVALTILLFCNDCCAV